MMMCVLLEFLALTLSSEAASGLPAQILCTSGLLGTNFVYVRVTGTNFVPFNSTSNQRQSNAALSFTTKEKEKHHDKHQRQAGLGCAHK